MSAAGAGRLSDHVDSETLSADERAELIRLRAQVAEQSKGIALLKKTRRTLRTSI
jgi:transposase